MWNSRSYRGTHGDPILELFNRGIDLISMGSIQWLLEASSDLAWVAVMEAGPGSTSLDTVAKVSQIPDWPILTPGDLQLVLTTSLSRSDLVHRIQWQESRLLGHSHPEAARLCRWERCRPRLRAQHRAACPHAAEEARFLQQTPQEEGYRRFRGHAALPDKPNRSTNR